MRARGRYFDCLIVVEGAYFGVLRNTNLIVATSSFGFAVCEFGSFKGEQGILTVQQMDNCRLVMCKISKLNKYQM